jgi:hypothetical protein
LTEAGEGDTRNVATGAGGAGTGVTTESAPESRLPAPGPARKYQPPTPATNNTAPAIRGTGLRRAGAWSAIRGGLGARGSIAGVGVAGVVAFAGDGGAGGGGAARGPTGGVIVVGASAIPGSEITVGVSVPTGTGVRGGTPTGVVGAAGRTPGTGVVGTGVAGARGAGVAGAGVAGARVAGAGVAGGAVAEAPPVGSGLVGVCTRANTSAPVPSRASAFI